MTPEGDRLRVVADLPWIAGRAGWDRPPFRPRRNSAGLEVDDEIASRRGVRITGTGLGIPAQEESPVLVLADQGRLPYRQAGAAEGLNRLQFAGEQVLD